MICIPLNHYISITFKTYWVRSKHYNSGPGPSKTSKNRNSKKENSTYFQKLHWICDSEHFLFLTYLNSYAHKKVFKSNKVQIYVSLEGRFWQIRCMQYKHCWVYIFFHIKIILVSKCHYIYSTIYLYEKWYNFTFIDTFKQF